MGYWKSKVIPKIRKVFGSKKPADAEPEAPAVETACKEVAVGTTEEKKEEKVEEKTEEKETETTPPPQPPEEAAPEKPVPAPAAEEPAPAPAPEAEPKPAKLAEAAEETPKA